MGAMEIPENTSIGQEARDLLSRVVHGEPGYRDRPGQSDMAEAVARTLAGEAESKHLLVEADTGSGKTIAYLAGGLLAAARRRFRLLVSTSTVALGEQLVDRELPKLLPFLGHVTPVRAAIAKGRSRYLCPARLTQRISDPAYGTALSAPSRELAYALADGWDGDRDHLAKTVDDEVWRAVSVDQKSCSGQRCEWFNQCPYYAQRARLSEATIIVTNHDLVIADLDAGGGIYLPAPDKTLYVFDEAHHLPERARRGMTREIHIESTLRALEKLLQSIIGEGRLIRDVETQVIVRNVVHAAREMHSGVGRLLSELSNHGPLHLNGDQPVNRCAIEHNSIPGRFLKHAERLACDSEALEVLLSVLQMRAVVLRGAGRIEPDQAEHLLLTTGAGKALAHRHRELWRVIADSNDRDGRRARWVESGENGGTVGHRVACAPLDLAMVLNEGLWLPARGTVLTGATLSRHGQFEYLRNELGLNAEKATHALRVPACISPGQAVLNTPTLKSDPSDRAAHAAEVAQLLPSLTHPGQSTLILFSSRQEMRTVLAQLSDDYRESIIQPDNHTPRLLLAEHRCRVSRGQGSILAGVAGLAEGIDLPGGLCEHVIITRLPFPSPDDALLSARSHWVAERGGNPFMEIVVPETAQRLVHAAGRLLRHEDDHGTITVLDGRLHDKGYGKAILRALPFFRSQTPVLLGPEKQLCESPGS